MWWSYIPYSKRLHKAKFNPLTPKSDEHAVSPTNIHTLHSTQQTDNENTQTYQVKVVILIYHQILNN